MQDQIEVFTAAGFRFHLPYRLFLDDAVYFVQTNEIEWKISLVTVPRTEITFTTPPISFGPRAQLRLDNHGFAGVTEVRALHPFEKPITSKEFFRLQTSSARITLEQVLRPINHLIAFYRAKTEEYWFRPLGPTDIPAVSVFLQPTSGSQMEWHSTLTNVQIASGYPYLKSESWYEDLARHLRSSTNVPFALELINEGRDAFARNNRRLAAVNFALAVEATFRALLTEFFPSENPQTPAEQMLGTYYRRYREIADPQTLPLRKKEAAAFFKQVWGLRDHLMHGHEVRLHAEEVRNAGAAAVQLFELWRQRPGAIPLVIEGPFANPDNPASFPVRDPGEFLRRAESCYQRGAYVDLLEAADYALALDGSLLRAHEFAAIADAALGNFEEALVHLHIIQQESPEYPGVVEKIEMVTDAISCASREARLT